MNNIQYKLRVSCMTFNHSKYITDAMNGFCMQQTDFPFVCTIIDDASTDGEQEVLRNYVKEHFDLSDASVAFEREDENAVTTFAQHKENKNCFFAVIYLKENHYSKTKSKLPYVKEWNDRVKYIAICEGDDYWIDPYKLQKQVDVLEKDETLMACVTNCSVVDDKGNTTKEIRGGVVKDDIEGRYNLRQFFDNNHQYPTLSVVYRNTHREEVWKKTKIMANPYLGDWTLWIALHCFGDFYFLNEVTCAYRINPTSVTHSNTIRRRIGLAKENFRLLPAVASILPDEGYEDIKKDLVENTAWMWYDLGHAYFKAHKYINAIWCVFRCGLKNPSCLLDSLRKR